MLIYAAIISRKWDIPCVTGIADATRTIRTVMYCCGWLSWSCCCPEEIVPSFNDGDFCAMEMNEAE
jgi:hypothetical protein